MRLVLTFAVLGCSLVSGHAFAQAKEEYFGMFGTVCAKPDTSGRNGGGAPFEASIPDRESEEVIHDFIHAARAKASTAELIDRTRLSNATIDSCKSAIVALTDAKCSLLPLYLLGDGEIRAEWLCDSKSAYMIFFTMNGRKISNIWSMDSTLPITVTTGS